MYAMHLATGSTLLCRLITLKTIKEYVKAAASFIALGPRQVDFRKENQTDTQMCPSLQAVYKELERWEKVPNRREPFTLEMLKQLDDTIKDKRIDQDSLQGVLADWFVTCLFLGSRKSEWAQDAGKSALDLYKKSPLKRAQAFTMADIEFQLLDGRRIPASDLPNYPSTNYPTRVWVTHSWQKNGEHGEKRMFTRNLNPQGRCPCRAWERIVRRFLRLRGYADLDTPLALYRGRLGQLRLVTATDVENTMRELASKTYKLDPIRHKAELQRWSCHSLRVGACTILHSMGLTGTQIKWLLRWRSDAFMAYLRNLAVTANQQVLAFDKAGAMPNFL
jgi:hypothetical protein